MKWSSRGTRLLDSADVPISRFCCGLAALLLALAAPAAAESSSWSFTGSLITKRLEHTATLLPNGNVLVAGGHSDYYSNNDAIGSAELYDPVAGTWSATDSLSTPRYAHTATLLPNGTVLVAGGYNGAYLATAELYDPAIGTWSSTGSMSTARASHTATLLPNGKVLVAGGYNGSYLTSAELYDPATGTWSPTGSLTIAREFHTATLLANSTVLVVSGFNSDGSLASAELYDPVVGTWSVTGNLTTAQYAATSTLLPNGSVLVVGWDSSGGSAELYNATAGTWNATSPLSDPGGGLTATLLSDGTVLVTGTQLSRYYQWGAAELYNPLTEAWKLTGSLIERGYHTATLLPNGTVLVAGGRGNWDDWNGQALDSAQLYDPTPFGGCTATPQPGCRQPQRASGIGLNVGSNTERWKWLGGSTPVALSDFGDPVSGSTDYRLCLYDTHPAGPPDLAFGIMVPAGGRCGKRPCWKSTRTGFQYANARAGGVRSITLKAPAGSGASIHLGGRGINARLPLSLDALSLLRDYSAVIVQLQRSDSPDCWESAFTSPALRNTRSTFTDKLP